MNAKQLYNVCLDSCADGRTRHMVADSALKEYTKCHCYHPLKVKCFDSHLGQFVERFVPCGKCYHCLETKQNEWCSRVYAHLEDFKYAYFVTLTYRSFSQGSLRFPSLRYIFNYLRESAFNNDSFNYGNVLTWSPCLLVKSHYQNYFKRLRKVAPIFTFFGCGEYGKRFGRPHYHFIIFSHEPIEKQLFIDAWSLSLSVDEFGNVRPSKNSNGKFRHHFGKVDVQELFTNGVFSNNKVSVDGSIMDAARVIKYVSKYVGKKSYNTKRIELVYNNLKNNYYETKNHPFPYSGLSEFASSFRPFICCSRGTPIGSLYFKRHAKEMAQGVFATPPLSPKGTFIVPAYFRRKASEYLYSLRVVSPCGCISKGSIPSLVHAFTDFLSAELLSDLSKGIIKDKAGCSRVSVVPTWLLSDSPKKLLNSSDCFVDVVTRSRFLIQFDYQHFESLYVNEYKYCGEWSLVARHDLYDWCLHYFSTLPKEFDSYLKGQSLTRENEKYLSLVRDWYDSFDRSLSYYSMVDKVESDNAAFFADYDRKRFATSNL